MFIKFKLFGLKQFMGTIEKKFSDDFSRISFFEFVYCIYNIVTR